MPLNGEDQSKTNSAQIADETSGRLPSRAGRWNRRTVGSGRQNRTFVGRPSRSGHSRRGRSEESIKAPSANTPHQVNAAQWKLQMTIVSVGAVASLVAAGLSGYATLRVADIESEMTQRSERIEAYSELVAASESYLSFYSQLPFCVRSQANNLRAPSPEAFEARNEVTVAATRAYLVGSTAGAQSAGEVDRQVGILHDSLHRYVGAEYEGLLCIYEPRAGFPYSLNHGPDTKQAEIAVSAFLAAARVDIDHV